MGDAEEVKKLLRQQAAIAAFGSFALAQSDLQTVLTEAAWVCANGLSVRLCKVCKYRPAENDLLIVAGCGWHPGVIEVASSLLSSLARAISSCGSEMSAGVILFITSAAA